jgi:hypothetical protein
MCDKQMKYLLRDPKGLVLGKSTTNRLLCGG